MSPPAPARRRVLVTGASGCVGHELVEELLDRTEHELLVVLRDPARLSADLRGSPRVRVVEADLAEPEALGRALPAFDDAILAAAAWGGPEADLVNVQAARAIARTLADGDGGSLVYVSSASVLDRDGKLLEDAALHGTEYIQSKHALVRAMEEFSGRLRVVGVFPTLVLGGREARPFSQFAELLRQAAPWAWLIGQFRAPARFHIIHARDLARVTVALLDAPEPGSARVVVGMPAVSADEAVSAFCAARGRRASGRFNLTRGLAEVLIRVFRIELSPWDRHCLDTLDQSYPGAVSPAHLGLDPCCSSLAEALAAVGIDRRR